ncbi:hypothetical protein C8R46DRAFT_1097958 [Mycena filopes]|nr:hypothetical protein C8R46DRAFT_1097958 [Mycena filopes]
MEDAWQSQDIAPNNSAINIPVDSMAAPAGDAWSGNGADADRDRDRDAASGGDRGGDRERGGGGGGARRGRSRSRSPAREGERGYGTSVNPGNNLHVSSLSHKIDTRDLEAAFAKIGRVKKASVMYDPHTRESRGFGFVTMESPEEADAAVAALNGTELGGKAVNVEKARRGRARTPTPGRYYGPPKRGDNERPYDPRPYDSRYSRDYDDRGGRGGGGRGRYDDYRGGRDDYRGGRGGRDDYRDDYRGGGGGGGGRDYDDRDRGGRGGGRGGYDERRY